MTALALPPLNALAPFEAVVRLGSVTAAAGELRLTHSAVSRQISTLERHLGRKLFHRKGRGLIATDDALSLADSIALGLETISFACRRIQQEPGRPLVVSCEPTLLQRWLLPRLPGLDSNIKLRLYASGGPVDLNRDGIDLAIRRHDFPLSADAQYEPLFPEWVGPVCSPDAARRLIEGDSIPCLTSRTRPEAWTVWEQLHERSLLPSEELQFDHFFLSLQAACAGLGVAIGPYALVADDLSAGRLVAPYGFAADGTNYLCLTSSNPPAQLMVLLAWLRNLDGMEPPDSLRL
ncbi:LysR family transcriptional regulator [Microbacterium sp. NPDC091662]|uniref:LysR family transcriptional regulator n=1 Tax=Microbacterium sp. NPDC091662 TaxID=3364211 RepID=UPI0037F54F87